MPILILCIAALLFYALYRRPHVRFVMKLLGIAVILEASDQKLEPKEDAAKALPRP